MTNEQHRLASRGPEGGAPLMRSPFLGLRRHFAAIVFSAGAFAVGACSSPGAGSGTGLSSTGPSANGVLPAAGLAARMSGSGWGSNIPFELGTNTQATSIDNGSGNSVYKIVGYYESNGQYNSFELLPPYYADPTPLPSPPGDPNYFYATGISDSHMVAGYANVPGGVGNTCSVCGFVYDDHTQSWSPQLQDPKEGTGACAKTYFTAIDDSGIAVGYYLHNAPPPQNTCISQAFEEYSYQTGAPQFVDLHPLTATGATPTNPRRTPSTTKEPSSERTRQPKAAP
jgi:rubredoxin